MSDDDDTGGGKKDRHKLAAQVEETGKKPVTLKVWVVVAIALAAFVLGAWIF